MTGDHPIFDGPLGADDELPTFVEIGGRRFDVEFEWKSFDHRYNEYEGWIASATVEGQRVSGSIGSPLRSLFDLVRLIKKRFNLQQQTVVTDIPLSIDRLSRIMTSTSR